MATDANVGIEIGVQKKILEKLDTTNYWFVKSPSTVQTADVTGTGQNYSWSYYLSYNMSRYTRTGKLCVVSNDETVELYGSGVIALDAVIGNSHGVTFRGYGDAGEHTVISSGYTTGNVYLLSNTRSNKWTNGYDPMRWYGNTLTSNAVNFGINFADNKHTFANGEHLKLQYLDGKSRSPIVPVWDETGSNILELTVDEYFNHYKGICKDLSENQAGVIYIRRTLFEDTIFINVPIVSKREDAEEYIRSGKLPNDAKMYYSENPASDGTTKPNIEYEKPTYTPQPTDTDTGEQKEHGSTPDRSNLPIITPKSQGCLLYACTAAQVNAFFNWLWNDIDWEKIVINSVTGLYGNLADCIIGLDYVPFPISELFTTATSKIVLGRYGTEISANSIGEGKVTYYKLDDLKIDPFRNDFFAYNGYTEIKLYLPCVGFVDLDANLVVGRTISIEFSYDVYTGHGSYALFSNGILFATYDCDYALHLPFAVSTMDSIVQKGVESVAQGVASIPNGGATMIASAIDLFTQSPSTPLKIGGSVNPTTAYMTGFAPRWFAKYPTPCPPSNFASRVGYLSMQKHTLSNLTGFTKCYNPRISFDKFTPTKEEESEIYTLLENGVVL